MGRRDGATVVALLVLVGVALIYGATSRGVLLYGDDTLMFQVTRSIVEDGDFSVTSPTYAEVAADPSLNAGGFTASAMPGEDGDRYAKYGIGQSLVAIPAYVAAEYLIAHLLALGIVVDPYGNQLTGTLVFGTGLANALIGAATVALLFLLVVELGYRQRTALVLAGLLAFGTLLPHYAASFLSEPLAALCLTLVVYGLVRARGAGLPPGWLAVSGFAAGLALATKLALGVALLAPGLWLLWMVWDRYRLSLADVVRPLFAWGGPVAFWLAGVGAYNWLRFGSPLDSGYGAEASAYTTALRTGLEGLVLSPGKGLFWYDPPLLLALIGAVWFGRRHPGLALVVLGMLAGMLLLYGRYYVWWGGGVWGPRFLVPLLPLALLPAAEVVERAWAGRRWAVASVAAAGVLGLIVTALPLVVPFDSYVIAYTSSPERLHDAIWNLADSPIVVSAGDVLDADVTLDIAAMRYGDGRLVVASLLAGLLGLALLAVAALRVRRAEDGRGRRWSASPDTRAGWR